MRKTELTVHVNKFDLIPAMADSFLKLSVEPQIREDAGQKRKYLVRLLAGRASSRVCGISRKEP